MHKLNSSNVFFLTMISFLGCIAIFALSFYYPHSIFYFRNKYTHLYDKNFSDYIKSSFHSTNNTLNISVKENRIYTDIKGFNDLSFLNKYENESEIQKDEKNLRNLSLFNFNYFNIAVIANFFSFYLCFFLFISFFIEINECETFCGCFLFYLCCKCCKCCDECCGECCDECYDDCRECKCCNEKNCCRDSSGRNMDIKGVFVLILFFIAIILVLLIIYGFCYGTYILTELCGKHLSRYIVLIIISFINLGICIICCLLIKENELIIYIIIGVSGAITLLNVLSMLITNINCCPKKESESLIDEKNDNMITLGEYITSSPETL